MRTIIAGGRDIHDPDILERAIAACPWKITEVVTGGATGVDQMGSDWARKHGLFQVQHCANWGYVDRPGAVIRTRWDGKQYDAAAGHVCNRLMAQDASALLAVWDGQSKGTKNMIEEARKAKLRVFIFNPDAVEDDWI